MRLFIDWVMMGAFWQQPKQGRFLAPAETTVRFTCLLTLVIISAYPADAINGS
ncbi:hypothetical protein EIO_2978 (plasmid) [Ketogulonicigenium vulgare Y25]|nr:hypothetical protein EIO_2978 [Ketogulonicigenium vulgare Y25]